jgi:multidrug efflux system membrane fusion protein
MFSPHRAIFMGTLILLSANAALLSGCQKAPPASQAEVSRPVPILEIAGTTSTSGLRFPGRVQATQRAELAFNVPGQVVEFPAEEGETLSAGALIARLDPATFDTRLSAARAEFDKARADYNRVREIWDKSKAVARAEVDQKRTAMEVARSSFAAAKQDAEDTRLTAPFDGVIARRHVENFQNVQAKEPIVSLQNVDELEIVIHVPERVMRSAPRRAAGYAQFDDVPGRRFPVSLKSYSTEADPQTQTYEVVLRLTRPQDVTILPGMSAEVLPGDIPENGVLSSVAVPLNAIAAGPDGTPRVWVVDPDTDRVAVRTVSVGRVQGSDIIVLDGLEIGERIVTAGLGHLREGMWVRPL